MIRVDVSLELLQSSKMFLHTTADHQVKLILINRAVHVHIHSNPFAKSEFNQCLILVYTVLKYI